MGKEENSNLNSITLFYRDCRFSRIVGSVKNLTSSPG